MRRTGMNSSSVESEGAQAGGASRDRPQGPRHFGREECIGEVARGFCDTRHGDHVKSTNER